MIKDEQMGIFKGQLRRECRVVMAGKTVNRQFRVWLRMWFSALDHLVSVWLWVSLLIFLSLNSSTSKMKLITIIPSPKVVVEVN